MGPHQGGYQQVDAWGYQILLNYRSYRSANEIAPTVTLSEVLAGKLKPHQIKDRIVLIGVTAQSAHDYIPTPYSASHGFYQEMPGVIVQAQMLSQILSAVKDGRPLLKVWTFWGDALWVWSWSIVGGVLAWRLRSFIQQVILTGATLGILYILCFMLLIQGNWAPFVPSVLAFVVTYGGVAVYISLSEQKHSSTSKQD